MTSRVLSIHIDGSNFGEVFGDVRPTTSMIEVNRLIDPELLVEVEAVAIIPE